MDKDLNQLYGIAMKFLLEKVSTQAFFTQKEFEDNYAIIMKLSKFKSNINKKIDNAQK